MTVRSYLFQIFEQTLRMTEVAAVKIWYKEYVSEVNNLLVSYHMKIKMHFYVEWKVHLCTWYETQN